jgi:hypothetical protein
VALENIGLVLGLALHLYINVCGFCNKMGCAVSTADADAPSTKSDRRLAICSSVGTLSKGDIVLIVRSGCVLEKGGAESGENTVYVQFNGKDGHSFEWIPTSEVCAVLQGNPVLQ